MSLVSIIIPARNEVGNIASTIDSIRDEFKNERIDYEIIVVNDGSTDDTGKLVKEISDSDSNVHIIKNRPPHGFGNAIKKGLDQYRGDMVMIIMADSSDDPKDMVKYVRAIEEGSDCCFGTRWGKGTVVKGYPVHKYILNRSINWWINIVFGLHYTDVTNAFKCYSRETINGIKPILSHHFNITVELPLKAIVRGYSYQIIPTSWRERKKGHSKLKLQEMGSRYLFIIVYIFLEKILCGSDYKKFEKGH